MGRLATDKEMASYAARSCKLFEMFRIGARSQKRVLRHLQDAIERPETDILVRLRSFQDGKVEVLETFRIPEDTVEQLAQLFLQAFARTRFTTMEGQPFLSTPHYVLQLRGNKVRGAYIPAGAVITECGGRRAWVIDADGFWDEVPQSPINHSEFTPGDRNST